MMHLAWCITHNTCNFSEDFLTSLILGSLVLSYYNVWISSDTYDFRAKAVDAISPRDWNVSSGKNKDHQRMMVDPMFMIVQSLRSFLTAVTPTAVAPIAVILPVFT